MQRRWRAGDQRCGDGPLGVLPVVRAFLEVRSADTASPASAVDVDPAEGSLMCDEGGNWVDSACQDSVS